MNYFRYAFTALVLVFAGVIASAQDIIVLKDGSTILSKVTEITKDNVSFKKFNNLDGPTYTYNLSDIIAINYENGQKEKFDAVPTVTPQTDIQSTTDRFTAATSDNDINLYYKYMDMQDIPKIKKYQRIGWIGGAALLIGGLATWYALANEDGSGIDCWDAPECWIGLGGGVLLGAAWTTGWLVAANKLKTHIQMFSNTPVFEQSIWKNSSKNLTAGADMIKCNINNRTSFGLGIGLRYNF